eukprot:494314_1
MVAMQYNDNMIIPQTIDDTASNIIINVDLHELKTNEPLFCVVEKHSLNDTQMIMKEKLFKAHELSTLTVPKSSRNTLELSHNNRFRKMITSANPETLVKACGNWRSVEDNTCV